MVKKAHLLHFRRLYGLLNRCDLASENEMKIKHVKTINFQKECRDD